VDFTGGPGHALVANLGPDPADATRSTILIEAGGVGAPDEGILVRVPDAAGGWTTVRTLRPRNRFDEFAVETVPASTVRLEFLGQHAVRFVGRLDPAKVATVRELAPTSAVHSRLGDVLTAVGGVGGTAAEMLRGDVVTAAFAAPALAEGHVRHGLVSLEGTRRTPIGDARMATAAGRATMTEGSRLPNAFVLHSGRPNPIHGSTTIAFDLPTATSVRLRVFDAQGRLVKVLAEGPTEPGFHRRTWDRTDERGERVAPGVYLCRFDAAAYRAQRKLVVLP
jgi:hypothetical protein